MRTMEDEIRVTPNRPFAVVYEVPSHIGGVKYPDMTQLLVNPRANLLGGIDPRLAVDGLTAHADRNMNPDGLKELNTVGVTPPISERFRGATDFVLNLLHDWDDVIVCTYTDQTGTREYDLGEALVDGLVDQEIPALVRGAVTKSVYIAMRDEQWARDRYLYTNRGLSWHRRSRAAKVYPFSGREALLFCERHFDVQVGTLNAALSQL